MKNIALPLAGFALVLGAPAVSVAQETTPAPQTCSDVQNDALHAYLLETVACMMENVAAQIENESGAGSPLAAFVDSFEATHKAVAAIPCTDLPEDFQAYIHESDAISREFVEQCRALLHEDGSDLSPEEQQEFQAIQFETQAQLEQLEAKYPAVAAKMGREAMKAFTAEVMLELDLKNKAIEWATEHEAELEAKGPAGMADVYRFMASELRKAAQSK